MCVCVYTCNIYNPSLQHPLFHTQHASQGDLLTYVSNKQYADGTTGRLKEKDALWFFQQAIVALDYMHLLGFSSRDFKLENCGLVPGRLAERPLLKLMDFASSKVCVVGRGVLWGGMCCGAGCVVLRSVAIVYVAVGCVAAAVGCVSRLHVNDLCWCMYATASLSHNCFPLTHSGHKG